MPVSTKNNGINPRDLRVYRGIAEDLNITKEHSFMEEIPYRDHFIAKSQALESTFNISDESFTTPNACFYKRFIIAGNDKMLKEYGNSVPKGMATTPSVAANKMRMLYNLYNLPVVCFIGQDLSMTADSLAHCWCGTLTKDEGKFVFKTKDCNTFNSGAKLPGYAIQICKVLNLKMCSLQQATNEEVNAEEDCLHLTYLAIANVLDGFLDPRTTLADSRNYSITSKKYI